MALLEGDSGKSWISDGLGSGDGVHPTLMVMILFLEMGILIFRLHKAESILIQLTVLEFY